MAIYRIGFGGGLARWVALIGEFDSASDPALRSPRAASDKSARSCGDGMTRRDDVWERPRDNLDGF